MAFAIHLQKTGLNGFYLKAAFNVNPFMPILCRFFVLREPPSEDGNEAAQHPTALRRADCARHQKEGTEHRSRPTSIIDERLYIYASLTPGDEEREQAQAARGASRAKIPETRGRPDTAWVRGDPGRASGRRDRAGGANLLVLPRCVRNNKCCIRTLLMWPRPGPNRE